MQTIKQIADYCGVSKTTVTNAIKRLNIEKIRSADGNRTIHISDTDAAILINEIAPNKCKPETTNFAENRNESAKNHNKTANQTAKPQTSAEEKLIDFLTTENENKQRIIDGLLSDKEVLNAQVMLLQNQIAELKALNMPEEPQPKGFWARLFGR